LQLFFYTNQWLHQLRNQSQRIPIRLQVVVQYQQIVSNVKRKNTIVGTYQIIIFLFDFFFLCRSDLVCRVRYTNVLPDLPFDPKFLRYPFSQDRFIIFFHFQIKNNSWISIRFVRYKPTSLEKNYRWDLLTEHDVGVEIDLINPDAYATNGRNIMFFLFENNRANFL